MATFKLLLLFASLLILGAAADTIIHDVEFSFSDLNLKLTGASEIMPDAAVSVTLNNATDQVFYANPLKFTRPSFSTSFVLTIDPAELSSSQHEGFSFIISPGKLLVPSEGGSTSLITIGFNVSRSNLRDFTINRENRFLINISINGVQSMTKYSRLSRKPRIRRGQQFVEVRLEYDGYEKEISGSVIAGDEISSYAPTRSSFSYPLDIGSYVGDHMFVGIAKSTPSDYYVSSWSLEVIGKAPEFDVEMIEKFSHGSRQPQDFQSGSSPVECRPCASCVEKFLRSKSNCTGGQIEALVDQLCHRQMDHMLAQGRG